MSFAAGSGAWVALVCVSRALSATWFVAYTAILPLTQSAWVCSANNYGLRHLLDTPALPRSGVRRRFACALATIMIVAAAWGFQTGMPLVGYIVGWSLVAAAFVNVSTGFCIPSFIVRMFFGKVICE
jgi:hypothetical protein